MPFNGREIHKLLDALGDASFSLRDLDVMPLTTAYGSIKGMCGSAFYDRCNYF